MGDTLWFYIDTHRVHQYKSKNWLINVNEHLLIQPFTDCCLRSGTPSLCVGGYMYRVDDLMYMNTLTKAHFISIHFYHNEMDFTKDENGSIIKSWMKNSFTYFSMQSLINIL